MLNKSIIIGAALSALIGCATVEQPTECVLDCITDRVLVDVSEVCEFVEVEFTDKVCMTVETLDSKPLCVTEIHCDLGAYTYTSTECDTNLASYSGTVCGSGEYSYSNTVCSFSDVEYAGVVCDDLMCIIEDDNKDCNNGGGNGSEGCSPSENGNEDEDDLEDTGSENDLVFEETEVCLDYDYACEEAACEEVEGHGVVEVCPNYTYTCEEVSQINTLVSGTVEVCIEEEDCWDELVPATTEVCDRVTFTEMIEVCSKDRIFENQTTCDESSCNPDAEWVQGGGTLGN